MHIIHALGNVMKRGDGPGNILLTNKKGNFFALGSPPTSNFQGLFYYDNVDQHPFKILHEISLLDKKEGRKKPDAVINRFAWAERRTHGAHERFLLSSNALLYEVEKHDGEIMLTFDCKRLYDDSKFGKEYHINRVADDHVSIRYEKQDAYGLTINIKAVPIINGDGANPVPPTFREVNHWRKAELPYDQLRGQQSESHVYDALAIRLHGSTRIIITFSRDQAKADKKLAYVVENAESVITNVCKNASRLPREDLELAAATDALEKLVTKLKSRDSRGIFAGLPWFFQFWGRDALIALGAFIEQEHLLLAKEVIMYWSGRLEDSFCALVEGGEMKGLESIDEPGLFCLRAWQLLRKLEHTGELKDTFSKEELGILRDRTITILGRLKERCDLHGFVTNGPLETWMDTQAEHDENGRAGSRIEIQALFLAVYDLAIYLCTKTRRKKALDELKQDRAELARMTREWFYDKRGWLIDGYFIDGQTDIRTRPNIFLAWYYAPNLFHKEEWLKAFDHALEKLWLPWGGLSSIGKDDPAYQNNHTGVDNKSYHRGDSWYFVNNIAALAMFSIDPHKYFDKIEAIRKASTQDLLFDGYVGCPSEISDAATRTARGTWCQAWSASTLIELILKIRS